MIRPPGWSGAVFSERHDGDLRHDATARARFCEAAGLSADWAVVTQVHGSEVSRVHGPGQGGEGDAMWTTETSLPVAVFTADCFGVILAAAEAVGVAHAGWRGIRAGVVSALREEMTAHGHAPQRAAVGPGIRSCCFEVGCEVAAGFEGHVSRTKWGTTSVDLPSALGPQLVGLEAWASPSCTYHETGWFSHRREATPQRMATVAWVT